MVHLKDSSGSPSALQASTIIPEFTAVQTMQIKEFACNTNQLSFRAFPPPCLGLSTSQENTKA
eukprot:2545893-Karenia_brevis.AAC.1